MSKRPPMRASCAAATRAGLSLVEVGVSTLLIGILLLGALDLIGATSKNHVRNLRRAKANGLADDLMGEIMQQSFAEPVDPPLFGTEAGEASVAAGPRTAWDDVDDYNGWSESPPKTKSGQPVDGFTGWRRWVDVKNVNPNDLSTALADADDRGVKRITVNASLNGELLTTLTCIHTRAWIDTIPDPNNNRTTGSKPTVNSPPKAVVSASPLTAKGPVTVQFDATASTDPEGDPLTYSWSFGNGVTGAGPRPQQTYPSTTGSPMALVNFKSWPV